MSRVSQILLSTWFYICLKNVLKMVSLVHRRLSTTPKTEANEIFTMKEQFWRFFTLIRKVSKHGQAVSISVVRMVNKCWMIAQALSNNFCVQKLHPYQQ